MLNVKVKIEIEGNQVEVRRLLDAFVLDLIEQENVQIDQENEHKKKLETRVCDLDFSIRTRTCLERQGVKTVGDILEYSPDELLQFRNMGRRSLEEIQDKLAQLGLSLKEDAE